MAASMSVRWRAFPCPITTPPDDRCLYHCISCFRDPVFYLSVTRSESGFFSGEGAAELNSRAASIRQELVRAVSVPALMIYPDLYINRDFCFFVHLSIQHILFVFYIHGIGSFCASLMFSCDRYFARLLVVRIRLVAYCLRARMASLMRRTFRSSLLS